MIDFNVNITLATYRDRLRTTLSIVETIEMVITQVDSLPAKKDWTELMNLMKTEADAISGVYEFFKAISETKSDSDRRHPKPKRTPKPRRKTRGSHLTVVK